MGDDDDNDDAIIRNADLPADVTAMLDLTERDDDKAITATTTNRWRPYAPTAGVTPRMPVPRRSVPAAVTRRGPKVSVVVEATGSNCDPLTVAAAKSEAYSESAMPMWEKPAPDSLAFAEGFLSSIQLGEDHARMLLDEGIKTHQDLLHIKEILGTESLRPVKESLKARGFTTFELIKFISAVKGIPT